MSKNLLTGGTGMLGKAILAKDEHFINLTRQCCNLEDKKDLDYLFKNVDGFLPEKVIHTAAKVGGINAHQGKHTQFLESNLRINTNIVNVCRENNIQKLIAVSSVAAFPANCSLLKEDLIDTGPVDKNEWGYALSKRILDQHIQLCREELDLDYSCIFPTNIYGPNDNFNLNNAHCIASLIHKTYLAINNKTDLELFGDGKSLRQFIYVDDLADICLKMIEYKSIPDRMIIAYPQTYSINDIVLLLRDISGFNGKVKYLGHTNGLRVRECNIERLENWYGRPTTTLEQGLQITWDWFCNNYKTLRK